MNAKTLYDFITQILAAVTKLAGKVCPFSFFFTIKIVFNDSKLQFFDALLQGHYRIPEEAENQKNKKENGDEYANINEQAQFFRKLKNIA